MREQKSENRSQKSEVRFQMLEVQSPGLCTQYSALSTQYTVISTRHSTLGIAFCCLAGMLMLMSGCSSYEPHMRSGPVTATGREPKQIASEKLACLNELSDAIANVKNAQDANVAASKVKENTKRYLDLLREGFESEKHSTPEQDKEAAQMEQRVPGALDTIQQTATDIKTRVAAAPSSARHFWTLRRASTR